MSKGYVAIIDYGVGNLLSVKRGFEYCDAVVKVTADLDIIKKASRVVLPGVGAFSDGMTALNHLGISDTILDIAAKGIPLLGICLGMQMLLDESEEFGFSKGLGLISGKVIPVPSLTVENEQQKIPHIGWGALKIPDNRKTWKGSLFSNINEDESVYFVHSFMASPNKSTYRLANCLYGGHPIAAAIEKDNIFGCQFHPEKSGEVGLNILKNFLNI